MIRVLITLPLLLVVLGAGALYSAYGEIEPCRVLAVERARRADIRLPFAESGLQAWTRLETSQMSSGDCAHDLLASWGHRLAKNWR